MHYTRYITQHSRQSVSHAQNEINVYAVSSDSDGGGDAFNIPVKSMVVRCPSGVSRVKWIPWISSCIMSNCRY